MSGLGCNGRLRYSFLTLRGPNAIASRDTCRRLNSWRSCISAWLMPPLAASSGTRPSGATARSSSNFQRPRQRLKPSTGLAWPSIRPVATLRRWPKRHSGSNRVIQRAPGRRRPRSGQLAKLLADLRDNSKLPLNSRTRAADHLDGARIVWRAFRLVSSGLQINRNRTSFLLSGP